MVFDCPVRESRSLDLLEIFTVLARHVGRTESSLSITGGLDRAPLLNEGIESINPPLLVGIGRNLDP